MSIDIREIPLTVQLKLALKKKLEALARAEQRTLENQTIRLLENGLAVFEWGMLNEKILSGGD